MAARTVPTHGTLFALTLASSGRSITDRAEAAAHLDRALAGLREAPVAIGTLGGHHLTASAQTRWDTHGSPWRHTTWSITGDTDLHTTTAWSIGSDGRPVDLGTIARLEHLVAGIPTAIEHATTHSEELQHTIAQARRLHGHPFTFATELAAARHRYADLTQQLTEQTNQAPAWEVVTPASAARPVTDPPPLDPGRGRGGPAI